MCWNDCFRKIFHYNRWDSVKELQYFCGELSFEYLYDLNKWNFLSNMRSRSTESSVMLQCDIVIDELHKKYGADVCSHRNIVFQFFSSEVCSLT